MIQISTLMWTFALFFSLVGFIRGWNRELVATAGILLTVFALFQFDGLLRGLIFGFLERDQVFLVQVGIFLVMTWMVYQSRQFLGVARRGQENLQSSALGGLVGFVNGYLIGGSLWYFLDINEYPLSQFVIAPGLNSPSAAQLNMMPMVLLAGGPSGSGDLLTFAVIALLFFVLVVV